MFGPLQPWIVGALVVVGCFFLTVGTVGLLRFDTVYNRMHATSKPSTLGTAAIFLAGYVQFGPAGAGLPSLLGIVFLFLTMPTGAHMIARSAERMGVPFREGVTWPEPPGADPDTGPRMGDDDGDAGSAGDIADGHDDGAGDGLPTGEDASRAGDDSSAGSGS